MMDSFWALLGPRSTTPLLFFEDAAGVWREEPNDGIYQRGIDCFGKSVSQSHSAWGSDPFILGIRVMGSGGASFRFTTTWRSNFFYTPFRIFTGHVSTSQPFIPLSSRGLNSLAPLGVPHTPIYSFTPHHFFFLLSFTLPALRIFSFAFFRSVLGVLPFCVYLFFLRCVFLTLR